MSDDYRSFYRRKLPHWVPEGAKVFLTWRLYGSLPPHVIKRLEAERRLLDREPFRSGESTRERKVRHAKRLFLLIDNEIDKAKDGPMWLKDAGIASVVEDALLNRYAHLYHLWAYVIMANHVHVFLEPKRENSATAATGSAQVAIKRITKHVKGYTAREANKYLGRTGLAFWQTESYDHWARDEKEASLIIAYIENNPVKAGLVVSPEEWRWSSARERKRRGWSEIRPLT
jgi:REP element-mobilizing transposase RayT